MVILSGSRSLIKQLSKEGVEVLFGMPGGANLPIYDELYHSDIRHILVRHEQLAAHMADGFARVSRRPGVCLATSGPGATNLVTGIATAFMDSIPMVAITGQVATTSIGKDAFQECDIVGVATPVTKYAFQPLLPKEIPEAVRKSFYIASSGRPGPVLIDIPKDVQTSEAEMDFSESKVRIRGYNPIVEPDLEMLGKAASLLLGAERPMILAGGGVAISGAFGELRDLAEMLSIPVATTFKGKGAFNETHPLALGPIGMHGHVEANRLILESDVLLAIGTRFSDRSTGKVSDFVPTSKVIHIDVDPSEIDKNKPVDIGIVGDVRASLQLLIKCVKTKAHHETSTWSKRVSDVKEICRSEFKFDASKLSAISLLKTLRKALPAETIVTTEVGQCQMWASLHFDVIAPGTFLSSTGLGTMGFGFPASIGAKVAAPDRPVVDIAGDGSFNMTEAGLATAVLDNIPVIVVVINNGMLGMVAQWQRLFYGRRYNGVKLYGVPDYAKLAEAYRAQGLRAQSLDEFSHALKLGLKSDVATVIDVPISPEEDVFPFVVPGTALKDMVIA